MKPLFPSNLLDTISQTPLVAGFSVDHPEQAVPIARALLKAGIQVIELTMRTPAALAAIEIIAHEVPEIILGVGTILSPEQLIQVQHAGAHFGVSPGLNPEVLKCAREQDFPFAPGIITPSELELAINHGCTFVKVFPAEPAGGVNYLKSIYAPYQHLSVSFFPLGGINQNNLKSYVDLPCVSTCGGSWLVQKSDLENQDYEAITQRGKEALATLST